jgi:hypothetical protein
MAEACAWVGCCATAPPATPANKPPNKSLATIDLLNSFICFRPVSACVPGRRSSSPEPPAAAAEATALPAAAKSTEALLRAGGTSLAILLQLLIR